VGLVSELTLVAKGWRWTRRSLSPGSATPFVPPAERREFPTRWARTPAGRVLREAVQRGALKPLVWRETRPRVHGLHHLDGVSRPVVFASNHASHLDTPLVLGSLPRSWADRVAVGAAADYFFDARWRAAATAIAFNAFPVERRGGKRLTSTARELLDEGWSLLLFPEGTRSADGWMGRFRHGTARLCCERGIPAVPIVIRGSYAAMPRGRSWPRPGRFPVSVRYGQPLYPGPGEPPRAFTQRLRAAVAQLWDEEETDWYASLRRQAERATADAGDGSAPEAEGELPGGRPDLPEWRRIWEATRPLPSARQPRVWGR
jgi:1-acyl-sn-glycerol-3-phosphate acyltransferase